MWWFLFILYLISIAMFGGFAVDDYDENEDIFKFLGRLIIIAITPLFVIPYIIYLLLLEKPIQKIKSLFRKRTVVDISRTKKRKKRGRRRSKKNKKRRI